MRKRSTTAAGCLVLILSAIGTAPPDLPARVIAQSMVPDRAVGVDGLPLQSKSASALTLPADRAAAAPGEPTIRHIGRALAPDAVPAPAVDVATMLGSPTGAPSSRVLAPRAADLRHSPAGPARLDEVTCPVQTLSLGSEVDGVLGNENCHLPQMVDINNPSLADQYLVTLPERGRLTVRAPAGEFNPYLVLTDDLYLPIAEATSAGADARISVHLPPGMYIVVIASTPDMPDGRGVYSMTAVFEPEAAPANCAEVRPLAFNDKVNGALAAENCRLFDLLGDVLRDSFIVRYSVAIPANGTLELEMTPTGFNGFVALLDADLNAIAAEAHTGGEPVTLIAHLAPGTYWVLVSSLRAGAGDFSLLASFDASAATCAPETVPLDGKVTGALDASDCHLSFLPAGLSHPSVVDVYRVDVPQTGVYNLNLVAEDFQPNLRIFKWNFTPAVVPLATTAGSKQINARVGFIPGTFYLAVAADAGPTGPGNYTLDMAFLANGEACSVTKLFGPSGSFSGALELSDCTLADANINSSADRVDQYTFTVAQRGRLSATMTGSGGLADPFLGVANAGGTLVAYGTSPGSITIDMALGPGEYTLAAGSIGTRPQAGTYQVTMTFTPEPRPAACAVAPMQPTGSINGSLGAGDCRVFDVMPFSPTDKLTDRYSLRLAQRGTVLLRMTSAAVDSWLEIFDAETYEPIAFHDDIDANTLDSEIELLLPAGDYIVHASTPIFANTGAYRLTSAFTPVAAPDPCPIADLLPDDRIDGQLAETGECALLDLPPGGYRSSRVDVYRLHVPQNGLLEIEYRSLGLDPELTLYDQRWNRLAYNDNISAVNIDARLEIRVPSGIFLVAASNEIDSFGDYILSTVFEPNAFDAPPTATPTRTGRPTVTATMTRPPTTPRTPTPTATIPNGGGGKIWLPMTAKSHTFPQP